MLFEDPLCQNTLTLSFPYPLFKPYWQLPLSSSKKRLCLSNQVLVPVPSESFHELWLDLLTGERPLGKPVMLSERRPSSSWASIWKVNGLSPRDHRLDGRKNEPIRGPDQPITPIGRWPRPRPMVYWGRGDLRPEAGILVVRRLKTSEPCGGKLRLLVNIFKRQLVNYHFWGRLASEYMKLNPQLQNLFSWYVIVPNDNPYVVIKIGIMSTYTCLGT